MNTPTDQTLRDETVRALIDTGYSALPTPLQVGEIPLDLESVYRGPVDRLDLAVVVEHPGTREESLRLYWQVQRLARALDAAGSRRTITVLVIGGIDDNRLLTDLQTISRVLPVDHSLPVRRLIAPLLNLKPPGSIQGTVNGMAQVRTSLKGPYSATLSRIVESAVDGSNAVMKTYAAWVDEAFSTRRGCDD